MNVGGVESTSHGASLRRREGPQRPSCHSAPFGTFAAPIDSQARAGCVVARPAFVFPGPAARRLLFPVLFPPAEAACPARSAKVPGAGTSEVGPPGFEPGTNGL